MPGHDNNRHAIDALGGAEAALRKATTKPTLVEACKLNGVDPQACLADVVTRIVDGIPQSRLDELMPWSYPTIPGLKAAA